MFSILESPFMRRTYLRRLLLTGTAFLLGSSFSALPGWARSIFDSKPLKQEQFAVLARAVGSDGWKLLVLEQIKASPLCWKDRADGLVQPSLNTFDFTGICSRYLDSNGYSLRTAGEDTQKSVRLRLRQGRSGLELQAMDPNRTTAVVVARARRARRNKDAFVKLTLEPGWKLERRAYQGRTLSHVYFANRDSLNQLIAKSSKRPNRTVLMSSLAQSGMPPRPPSAFSGKGPIPLKVIPFRP